MKFGCVFAVKNVAAARAFYEELFGLKVEDDFGRCIGFDCGLSLQQDFDWLTGVSKEKMKEKENNCELYFEITEFDRFLQKLKARGDIVYLHDVTEQPWGQRGIRFYDPDGHLIEVGESMKSVVERFQAAGLNTEEIARRMDIKPADVHRLLQG